jgi:hypothetical protein
MYTTWYSKPQASKPIILLVPLESFYHFCRSCLQPFSSNRALHKHMEYCSRHEAQRTVLPEAGKDDTLQFRDFHKQLRVPYVIYCDLEAFTRPLDPSPSNDSSGTSSIIGFEACGFGYQFVCMNERSTTNQSRDNDREPWLYNWKFLSHKCDSLYHSECISLPPQTSSLVQYSSGHLECKALPLEEIAKVTWLDCIEVQHVGSAI